MVEGITLLGVQFQGILPNVHYTQCMYIVYTDKFQMCYSLQLGSIASYWEFTRNTNQICEWNSAKKHWSPKMQNNWWTHKVLIFLILFYFCIGFVLLPVYFSIFPLCDNNSCRSYSLLKAIAKVRKTYRYHLKEY